MGGAWLPTAQMTPVFRWIDSSRLNSNCILCLRHPLLTPAFHGVQAQNSTLAQQVSWIEDFLRNNPRETVILSIKQEQEDAENFPQLVQDALSSGMWYFNEPFATLGEVRGKGIFFSRFGKKNDGQFPDGQGLKPMSWPDNRGEGFEQDWHGTQFRIHDWYVCRAGVGRSGGRRAMSSLLPR